MESLFWEVFKMSTEFNFEKKFDTNHENLSVITYITTQLQEIICMGPGHALTWADNREHLSLSRLVQQRGGTDWMQVSVHKGQTCSIMVQFVVPVEFEGRYGAVRGAMNHLFAQYGWTNGQADGREALVYHIGHSQSARGLLDNAEDIATRCAEVMARLWHVEDVRDIALLGARGPRLSLPQRAVAPVRTSIGLHAHTA